MPSYNYAFSGGSTGIGGYGDRWQVQFSGTWVNDEKWGLQLVSSAGDYNVGSNNFYAQQLFPQVLNFCSTFKNRVYLAAGGQFNYSDNGDPTGWERQNSGAGFVKYLSYFGVTTLCMHYRSYKVALLLWRDGASKFGASMRTREILL